MQFPDPSVTSKVGVGNKHSFWPPAPLTPAAVPLSRRTLLAEVGTVLVDAHTGEHLATRIVRHGCEAVRRPRDAARGTWGAHGGRVACRGAEISGVALVARRACDGEKTDENQQVGYPATAPAETWVARRTNRTTTRSSHRLLCIISPVRRKILLRATHMVGLAHPPACPSRKRGRASERQSARAEGGVASTKAKLSGAHVGTS
jgi:hypothetical protein